MLDGNDKATFYSIRLLRDKALEQDQPIVFWIGAGVSAWNGYPRWKELAEKVHMQFLKYEGDYEKELATIKLNNDKLPEYFSYCTQVNQVQYRSIIAETFLPKPPTPVYMRFIDIMSSITPRLILTTNIDQCLEDHLTEVATVERADIERCVNYINKNQSFVCKLHGSISSIESIIFTKEDYENLLSNNNYISLVEYIFSQAIVVFLGYGLGDQYVIQSLLKTASQKQLFGDGPHFLVTSSDYPDLPESIRTIKYRPDAYKDHRAAMQVLDIIRYAQRAKEHSSISSNFTSGKEKDQGAFKSAYFISDLYPPGTWTTSQTFNVTRTDGETRHHMVGQGFVKSETVSTSTTALHDLIIGIICFDVIYFPLSSLSKVHELLGSARFWYLVKEGILKFIYLHAMPSLTYQSESTIHNGSIDMISKVQKFDDPEPVPLPLIIKQHLKPVPGQEHIAEQQFDFLKKATVKFSMDESRLIPNMVRGALLHSPVKSLLGISDAILPTDIPRWVAFPVLRLSHVVQTGAVCREFNIPAVKIPFGGEKLVGAAFSISAAGDWAEDAASYVLSGRFRVNLQPIVERNPHILDSIVQFRDTQPGIRLRKEILDQLSTNNGSEFEASVNAQLQKNISPNLLQEARDELSNLLFAQPSDSSIVPAVWSNRSYADDSLKLWRERSRHMLKDYCSEKRIRRYDLCPCGSGEKLRFCCEEALK